MAVTLELPATATRSYRGGMAAKVALENADSPPGEETCASIPTSEQASDDRRARLAYPAVLACRDLLVCHCRGPGDLRSWPRPTAAVLLVGGAILMLPASLYLTATPRFQHVGFVPVACLLLAAYAVRRACRVLGQARSTHRHRARRPDDEPHGWWPGSSRWRRSLGGRAIGGLRSCCVGRAGR